MNETVKEKSPNDGASTRKEKKILSGKLFFASPPPANIFGKRNIN
jgi:hypothetical protein